jgi:hypothetical protein
VLMKQQLDSGSVNQVCACIFAMRAILCYN